MLKKVNTVTYITGKGTINFDEPIVFMEGDTKALIQLRGELDDTIKATLLIKPLKGDIVTVKGVIVPYKGISREFIVPTKVVVKYQVQLVLQAGGDVNKSMIFEYEVLASLNGGTNE